MVERVGRDGRSDDMEIRFPFGGSLRAGGKSVILIVLAVGLAALGIWHDVKNTAQNTAVIEALQAVSYVLTLSEVERKRLRLDMPEALRRLQEKARERDR